MDDLCVVISYYDARPKFELERLLRGLRASKFDLAHVLVSVNTMHDSPLRLAADLGDVKIVYRTNSGFNMGAWDFGWRARPGYRKYLFLQDECSVVRSDWANRYIDLLDSGHGRTIFGESLQYWLSWRKLRSELTPIFSSCQKLSLENNISLGRTPSHLQALAIATSAEVIRAVDGFIVANEKMDAVAAEILFSRRAIACGFKIRQSAWRPFEYFMHDQWVDVRRDAVGPRWAVSKFAKQLLLS